MKLLSFLPHCLSANKVLALMVVNSAFMHSAAGDIPIKNPATGPGLSPPRKAAGQADNDQPLKARLLLNNGDKITGLPQSVDEQEQLRFNSDYLAQAADFPLANILSLQLDHVEDSMQPEIVTRIQLNPRFKEVMGDTILGELKELTPDSIKLETWYGGQVNIRRSMVKSLNILSTSEGNYHGPNNIEEWTVSDQHMKQNPDLESQGRNSAWYYSGNTLTSRTQGSIGKDVGLTENSHLGFDVSWKSSMRFNVLLYSNSTKQADASAYYEINVSNSHIYMNTRGKTPPIAARFAGARWKQIPNRPQGKEARFDIFTNRKTGNITIYINGVRACMLQSQNPDPSNLGKGLVFTSKENDPISISNISVGPWDGVVFPNSKPVIKELIPEDQKQPPHKIILINGDEVPGTIGIVDDGRMVIETEYATIRVPIDKIKNLSLGNSNEEPKKYSRDIRAWFHSGGFVTLKLAAFENNKISGYNQALGDVDFELTAFRRIDFHIYSERANATREKIGL